jgi:RNA polymerase sigma-70 factor (ECF subfamily)
MGVQREAREPASGGETDESLLRRSAAGDTAAFRELFDRYEPLLTSFLVRALGSPEDAEEAVSDAFLKLWRSAPTYRAEATVRTWLFRIAHHTAIDVLRRRRRQPVVDTSITVADDWDARLADTPELINPEAAMLAGYQRARDQQALRLALTQLEPSERTLVALYYFEGCSYAQIREIMGASLACIKSRLYRARQRLREHFVRLRDSDEDLEMLAHPAADSTLDARRLLAL